MKHASWVVLCVLLISSLILAGCSTNSSTSKSASASSTQAAGNAPATIKVGVVTSITGGDSTIGLPTQYAIQQAINDVNKNGGVMVKAYNKKIPLEMDLRDGQTDPEKVMGAAEQVNADGCPVAVGAGLGGIAAGIFEKNKLAYIMSQFGGNATSSQGFKYYFNTEMLDSDEALAIFALIDSLPKGSVPTKWAYFEEQADWVAETVGYMKQESAKRNITVSYEGQYQMLATDMSQLILGAKKAGAEVIFGCPTTPDGISILKQMLQLDYHPKAIIFFRASDVAGWGDLGPLGNYVIGAPQWLPQYSFKDPIVQSLVKGWGTESKSGGISSALGAYGMIQVAAAAIEKAGSLDRNAIRDAIASTDLDTVIGHVKFNAAGVRINPPLVCDQWQNGTRVMVWPQDRTMIPNRLSGLFRNNKKQGNFKAAAASIGGCGLKSG